VAASRDETVGQWRAEGASKREIARRLGVDEKVVRKMLRRLGWREPEAEQGQLQLEAADPNLPAKQDVRGSKSKPAADLEGPLQGQRDDSSADPNLSAKERSRQGGAATTGSP
jgi:hypothetical protein